MIIYAGGEILPVKERRMVESIKKILHKNERKIKYFRAATNIRELYAAYYRYCYIEAITNKLSICFYA